MFAKLGFPGQTFLGYKYKICDGSRFLVHARPGGWFAILAQTHFQNVKHPPFAPRLRLNSVFLCLFHHEGQIYDICRQIAFDVKIN